ncbi:uncharacterized protein K489DRAFT_228125 [Dissoconium aciculare CBS 342.82]|uniref:Uncharacterized protein n=1 Tax=Dissoconium aciculare CBS 342.82 TaxID=1314786 RepID=A0A6J3M1J8_9PEZI|nr:uncharacterized protein K489DRAFT_228125 [Dissoconium aciculare CBS 342.82]KAF1821905.1 hypothetical protein K489DRAFT_228125 [Dissoconium aciculare CBS 342.82]
MSAYPACAYGQQYLGPGRTPILNPWPEYASDTRSTTEAPSPPSPQHHRYSHQSKQPRAPRPTYTDEQKFFIMYARIVCGYQWTTIKAHFENLWEAENRYAPRTEEGLTSVYYRVRAEWGLKPVQAGPASEHDRAVVHGRATYFSRDFLSMIRYLPSF